MENKKRSLENGKWKKIVNKHNKKMVALALAGTLMGAQLPGNIEQVEASEVSVTSATTTNSSTFLTAVRRMDNLAAIKQMNVKSLGNISDSVTTARSIYDKLPAEAKTDKDVVKWEGYLTQKEEGIANRFVAISRQLPTNSNMEKMSASELGVARSGINNARKLYNKLPANVKEDSGVTRWEEFLTSKENTSGATFLNVATNLPNTSAIKGFGVREFSNMSDKFDEARKLFDEIPESMKNEPTIKRWNNYLEQKEVAVVVRFVNVTQKLATLNQLSGMDSPSFDSSRSEMVLARRMYDSLPETAKEHSSVIRWEGHLNQKEDATGITFVNAARALPNVAEIKDMNEEELLKYYEEAEKVKDAFNSLSDTAKSNTQVSTWGTYLATKEDAAYEVAEELEVELPERAPNDKVEDEGPTDEKEPETPVEPEVPEEPVEEVKTVTKTITKTETIEFDVKVIKLSRFTVGEERVVTEGVNGQRDIVYKQTYHDGVLVNEELLSNTVTREPVTKVVHLGVHPSELDLDQQVFSQELLKLVNELRVSVGVNELTYDNTLQEGVNIRAREVLDVFSHTRPDGRHYITAFGYEDGETNYYLAENAAINNGLSGFKGVDTLERYMAKRYFNQYYNSEGHYNNMVNERHVTFATGIASGEGVKTSNVQIFGTKYR